MFDIVSIWQNESKGNLSIIQGPKTHSTQDLQSIVAKNELDISNLSKILTRIQEDMAKAPEEKRCKKTQIDCRNFGPEEINIEIN